MHMLFGEEEKRPDSCCNICAVECLSWVTLVLFRAHEKRWHTCACSLYVDVVWYATCILYLHDEIKLHHDAGDLPVGEEGKV